MDAEDFGYDQGVRAEKKRRVEELAGYASLLGVGLVALAIAIGLYACTHRYKYYQECLQKGGMVVEDTWTGKVDRRFE